MGFDYQKFERIAKLGSLVGLGCSRNVLRNFACGYAIAAIQPRERRGGLQRAGLNYKQLTAKASAARDLAGFLKRLPQNPSFVVANDSPNTPIPVWCLDLEYMAKWIERIKHFHPDKKDAALALAMHVEKRTGEKHFPEIRKLLNAALICAGLPELKDGTLVKQIQRANLQRAEELLRFWDPLPHVKNLQK